MLSPRTAKAIDELAAGLAKICEPVALAAILNSTLTADEDERLTYGQQSLAMRFHDAVCKACPEAMHAAANLPGGAQ